MRILFLHSNFPGHFRYLAPELARNSKNEVVFITACPQRSLPGVKKILYSVNREVSPKTHRYVQSLENAVLQGQAVFRAAQQLKQQGFYPDVIYGHAGSGVLLFMRDLFPDARIVGHFEWFYHAHGTDADFDPSEPLTLDDEARIRMLNASILLDLNHCDRGICPTQWQKSQFPPEYQKKLLVIPDQIDRKFFCPNPNTKMVLRSRQLDLSHVPELVTYVARGLEPYRGFPQFMEAIALVQQRRPQCHAVIMGEDRVAYGRPHPSGKTYKQVLCDRLELDHSRLHFVGIPPMHEYRQMLQASSVHVHLCRPFLLSWSLLEALSCGCKIIASDTPPVREAITDGENGILTDFFDVEQLSDRIQSQLEQQRQHPTQPITNPQSLPRQSTIVSPTTISPSCYQPTRVEAPLTIYRAG